MGGQGGTATGGGGSGGAGPRLLPEMNVATDGTTDDVATLWFWQFAQYEATFGIFAKPEHLFWDSLRAEDCVYQPAADGKVRCLPYEPDRTFTTHYPVGGQCVMVAIRRPDPTGCSAKPKYATVVEQPLCQLVEGLAPVHLYPVGDVIATGVCTYDDAQCAHMNCNEHGKIFSLGPEIDPSSFVAGTLTHDP
ncbi:MAG TPA: hypothetical protein VHB21_25600 [Minicystis sp.]|nr:hypothetical protein [Minicystis sp.]